MLSAVRLSVVDGATPATAVFVGCSRFCSCELLGVAAVCSLIAVLWCPRFVVVGTKSLSWPGGFQNARVIDTLSDL